MTKKKPARAAPWVLLSMCWVFGAAAAPVDAADAPDTSGQPGAAIVTAPAQNNGVTDKSGSSHTVDMLIELQSKSAGLDFRERARENGAPPRSIVTPGGVGAPVPGAAPAMQSQGGLFGSAAVPTPVARDTGNRDSDWRGSTRSVSSGSVEQAHETNRDEAASNARGLLKWPREVILWVRENRSLAVGGTLLLLALLWVGSLVMSHRKH